MKFFDRDNEICELRKIREMSHESARFTLLTGRRRVGKTKLVKQAYSDDPFIYFYVCRTKVNLCEEFREIATKALGRAIPGRIERFSEIFRFICDEAVTRPITLVIDEFQDFVKIDESIFSEMARDWDAFHVRAKLNLVGWWDRKGENEIDVVGENEFHDTIEFVEIMRDVERIRLDALKDKSEAFFEKNPDKRSRTVSYRGFSISDM